MTSIGAVTFIVPEPGAVARQLEQAFDDWEVTQDHEVFTEVKAGDGVVLWFNVPSEPTTEVQQGVVVHYSVEDVATAAARARDAGAVVLREPMVMDFGMESAMVQVEGGPIVDLCRPVG